jgi:ABC-type multidrug transport system fused ATPase/permease subunit
MWIDKCKAKWRGTTVARSLRLLSRRDQKKISMVVCVQIILGLLDLIGVALVGILGVLAINGIKSQQPGGRVYQVIDFLGLETFSFQSQTAIIGAIAAFVLILRTLSSVYFSRKIIFFLSRKGADISSTLISRILAQPLLDVQSRSTQETLYAVTTGVSTITLGVLATGVNLISDGSLMLVMIIGLTIVDPVVALCTFAIFGTIGIVMYKVMHVRARTLGIRESKLNIKSNQKIVEVLDSYRETIVRNRREFYSQRIGSLRKELADTMAEITFMPNVSKYVIETSVVLGALLISAVQFLMNDASQSIGTLSIFLAAGTRIAPAVLRAQQGALSIRSALGSASPTLNLIESLSHVTAKTESVESENMEYKGFEGSIELKQVYFEYPGAHEKALESINLKIRHGQTAAIVGTSGAGKTTIVDVILGVLQPDSGEVLISNQSPIDAIEKWPGAIAYVPQDVTIVQGTIRENIGLGYPTELASDARVSGCIELAQLQDFVSRLPKGLDEDAGENGSKISGGQRQRIGIARALFTNPKLIILDEATSALDGQTEADLTDAIRTLRGEVTVIMIAHRLSTVRDVDTVIYMDKGRIIKVGTFDEVRKAVPDFELQAQLMGL